MDNYHIIRSNHVWRNHIYVNGMKLQNSARECLDENGCKNRCRHQRQANHLSPFNAHVR